MEIAATADLIDLVENWMHYYVEAVSNILRRGAGDMGDGMFFPGTYQVDVQLAQIGGSGFMQLAQVTCELSVSRNQEVENGKLYLIKRESVLCGD